MDDVQPTDEKIKADKEKFINLMTKYADVTELTNMTIGYADNQL